MSEVKMVENISAKEVIETAVVQAKENYNEEAVARQLAEQRFLRIKGVELLKAKARVYGYLIRRGFSPDISSQIVKGLWPQIF